MAQALPALAACPETNNDRLDYENGETTYALKGPDGRTVACWLDQSDRAAITVDGTTYNIAIRCPRALTIYTYWDGFDHGLVEFSEGTQEVHEARFLGDRYECNAIGQAMIKTWVYQRGNSVLNLIIREYTPYRW